MTWTTWRQSRLEMLLGLATLAAVAILCLAIGLDARSAFRTAGLPACVASHGANDDCWSAAGTFIDRYASADGLFPWLNFLPLLLGMLLAAPIVLEFESGTHRLAWTQSVTRGRWFAAKIGFGLAAATGAAIVLTVLWTWRRAPFDALQGRFHPTAFDFEGIVPFAYVIFAFALCVATGVILRRTVPALAISIVVFLATRVVVENYVRPRFRPALRLDWSPTAAATAIVTKFGGGDWIISQGFVDASGHAVNLGPGTNPCLIDKVVVGGGPNQAATNACFAQHGLMNSVVYQPASRFWLFQGIESAIYLGLAAILLLIAVWWVLRRIV